MLFLHWAEGKEEWLEKALVNWGTVLGRSPSFSKQSHGKLGRGWSNECIMTQWINWSFQLCFAAAAYLNWFVLPVYWYNRVIFRTHPCCLDCPQFLPNYVISTVIFIVLAPARLCSSPFLLCKVVRPLFMAICITDHKTGGSELKTKLYFTEDST